MRNNPRELETRPVNRLLLKYAVPSIVASTTMSIFNIIDSIYVGHGVGSLGLSAMTVVLPFMNLMVAFSLLVAMGGANLMSIRLGQKDYRTANAILGNVITMSVIYAVVINIVCYLYLDEILIFSGASPQVLPYARDFMQVFLAGNVFTQLFFNLNAMLRSSAAPRKAMLSTVGMVLINITLNPIFIFGLHMGMRGSALATILSETIMLCYQLRHFSNKHNLIHLRRDIFKLRWDIVGKSMSIGLSPFLMNVSTCMVTLVITNTLNEYGGYMAVGAYGIINRFMLFFMMIVIGLMQGMQPIIGYNFGAELHERVMKTLRLAMLCATIASFVGFLLGESIPWIIASWFTNDEALREMAVKGMRIMMMAVPLSGIQVISTGFFQSIGRARIAAFLSLLRQLILLVPSLLLLPLYLGMQGVWMSMPLSDVLATAISVIILMTYIKRHSLS